MKNLLTTLFTTVLMAGSLCLATPALAKDGYSSWKNTLTEAQQQQVAKLKLDFKKQVLPIKAKIKQARIELAMLTTANKPDQNTIDKKIDEILKLKGEKIHAKAKLRVEIRKVLNEAQRVKFDLYVLKKASHGKKRYHHKGHH
ncbi:MAG: periplasmic heavy metal sensor [Gammaproteobacteria bacterium]|nr:MAG: periplasmic heavy metal sensor [Gammaproteobacteria bacterium]